jgi:hypothetical protein
MVPTETGIPTVIAPHSFADRRDFLKAMSAIKPK